MAQTREQHREYMRRYRARQRGDPEPGISPSDGPVRAAVVNELSGLPRAAVRHSEAAVAVRMAELLDDDSTAPQKPAAAARLRAVMDSLRGSRSSAHSPLAVLRGGRD